MSSVMISRLNALILVASAAMSLAVAPQQSPARRLGTGPNTWSARSAAGAPLGGTWTAVIDAKTGAVTGTWTLADASRRTAARGTWSAAKSPTGWSGAWRAAAAGSRREYAGSWEAAVDLAADAPLGQLFEQALQRVVSGRWRAAGQSGPWSIRAFD